MNLIATHENLYKLFNQILFQYNVTLHIYANIKNLLNMYAENI